LGDLTSNNPTFLSAGKGAVDKIHDISLRAQISLALGDYSSDKLPLATTKKVQKAITLFFSVCRGTVYDETTEAGIKVHFLPNFAWNMSMFFVPALGNAHSELAGGLQNSFQRRVRQFQVF
jgi:hypothetical protein